MKNLRLFSTTAEADAAYANDYEEPWTSLTDENGEVRYNKSINANGHEYVDLGLPSGTLWATMNIGATSPEEYGDYFAWGETEPRDFFPSGDYKWDDGTNQGICTKYNDTDNLMVLELEDDSARANWGGGWKMPTEAQMTELTGNTTSSESVINEVTGITFTSTINGNSVFFPYGGKNITGPRNIGSLMEYWSSSRASDSLYAKRLSNEGGITVAEEMRSIGFKIRAVI